MATIYEVAEMAGVSPKTAARILAGKSGRPKNRERVQQAAKELGYVRNQQAANLRSGRSGLIGVIVPNFGNPAYPSFIQTIYDAAASRGYQILLGCTFGKVNEQLNALRTCEVNRVEGIILNASEGEGDEECDGIIRRFVKRGIPVVLAGRPARNLPVDEIVIRNAPAIERATHYLIKVGHRDIAFISGAADSIATELRKQGYEKALQTAGITPDPNWILYGDFNAESGQQKTHDLLASTRKPTAIIAANDLIALGAIRACHELGVKVPGEMDIIGFDDIEVARLVTPALTTLRQPQRQIAREVVALMMERIQNADLSAPRQLVYDPELIVRESA